MKKLTLILIAILICQIGYSQQPDLNAFIEETQINKSETTGVQLGWWIPLEFWKLSFDAEPSMTTLQKEEMYEVLKEYMVFGVVDGEQGPFGGIKYAAKDSIIMGVEVSINGKTIEGPVPAEELNPDMEMLMSSFKPVLKNMLGPMGENFHFIVFKDQDKKGNRIANPYDTGVLSLVSNNETYTWKLPVESLLPMKKCPEDNQLMNGGWNYCPYHGKELLENSGEKQDEK